jgi:hypothetical protein
LQDTKVKKETTEQKKAAQYEVAKKEIFEERSKAFERWH